MGADGKSERGTEIRITPVEPDWSAFLANLRREGTPERVFYFEHGIANNILLALAERFDLWRDLPPREPGCDLLHRLAVHRFLGHELFRVFPPGARIHVPKKTGPWVNESRGSITGWPEFDAFPWPEADAADLSVMERLEALRPENMRAFHVMPLWEIVRDLMGFEPFCFAIFESPGLVEAIFEKVGSFAMAIMRALCDFDTFGAIYIADDLGYKTGLMIAPDQIRHYIMPWHAKLADLAHEKGKLLLFHSCGRMYELMDDYIDVVGIDAKHSFEDVIMPVTEAKKKYGTRLSLLGGVDVDFLARAEPDDIRKRTREILEICQPGGGYCLGSGNWVTDYLPLDHYLAMLDEARRFGAE